MGLHFETEIDVDEAVVVGTGKLTKTAYLFFSKNRYQFIKTIGDFQTLFYYVRYFD